MSDELDVWFEEELPPVEAVVEENVKALAYRDSLSHEQAEQQVRTIAQGILRVDKPRWQLLDAAEHKVLPSRGDGHFYFVRLGFQFDLTEEGRQESAQSTYARCEAYLWPVEGSAMPTVYEILPRDLYDGEPRQVHVEFGPQIKLGDVGGSIGKISTDFSVGRVEPVVVGFTGENERAPYWDLRPKSKSILGVRHLWLIIESPNNCGGIRLATRVQGDIETHFGPIPIGPKNRQWESRPSIVIK